MRFRRRRNIQSDTPGSGSQVLALALFIMMLAFFIVLTAISSFEENKVKPIMESIETAFAIKVIQAPEAAPSAVESEEVATKEGDTFDKLESLFKAQIPGYEAQISKSRGVMHVVVPYNDFQEAVMALGQQADAESEIRKKPENIKDNFLPMLVALLNNEKSGIAYHMDAMLNVADNPARLKNQDPDKIDQMMESMSRLADKIEQTGLPARFLSMGLQQGEANTVELFFRVHRPFNPLGQTPNDR